MATASAPGRAACLLLGAALLALTSGPAGAALVAAPAAPSGSPPCDELKETWGIEVVRLFLTSRGHMLDFRYRVLDPVKARPLFDQKVRPRLVDESSGLALAVPDTPKTGPLRTTRTPEAGRTYFILFQNQAGLLEKGDLASVVIGGFAARHLVVQ